MIIKRILFSFVIAAIISVGIAVLGLVSTSNIERALVSAIEVDLPASESLGEVGRQMMSIQSSLNALLNPNLNMEERRIPRDDYTKAKTDLAAAVEEMNSYIRQKGGDPRLSQAVSSWREFEGTSRDWLQVAYEIMNKYGQWENTSILNPTALLMSLEKYRGDHFFLVRRISEMISRGEVLGLEVGPDAGLCAFGRWQTNFESGTDPLAGNRNFQAAMNKMKDPHAAFHATAADIYQLIKNGSHYNQGPIQRQYLQLLAAADQVIGNFDSLVREAGQGQRLYQEAADAVSSRLLPLGDRLQANLDSLMGSKRSYDLENRQIVTDSGQRFITLMITGAILTLVLLSVIAALVLRNITNVMSSIIDSLNEAAGQVDQSSGRLLHASNTLSEGATANAASLEETSAALEELSSMTRRNADNAGEADSLMSQTTLAVGQADSSMAKVIKAMDEISISGNEIGKIIKTIDEIAFQTNLLALNAAVEAARAGDAGSGFAVVADEVRNLAIRSAEAAKSTAGLIETTISNIKSGSEMVQTAAQAFHLVRGHSSKIAELLAEVAEASKEQAQGIGQITSAMNQMDKVTQSNADSAEESAGAAGELSSEAGQLLHAVADLKALIQVRRTESGRGLRPQNPASLKVKSLPAGSTNRSQPSKSDNSFLDF